MTRKDYELIAATLRRVRDSSLFPASVQRAAMSMADAFAIDNKRFDRERFLCGVI